MRLVIQRVLSAEVKIDGNTVSSIGQGFLIFVGVSTEDALCHAEYLAAKVAALRIFEDENGKMNLPLSSCNGSVLAVSNFTLYGNCKKGNRPSFIDAASGEAANEIYEHFCKCLSSEGVPVSTGVFGADMKVGLVNDGPITIIMDTKEMGFKQPLDNRS